MMGREAFETATRRKGVSQGSPTGALARYRSQVAVSILVVIVLTGGALYAARVSERAPQVVYSAALMFTFSGPWASSSTSSKNHPEGSAPTDEMVETHYAALERAACPFCYESWVFLGFEDENGERVEVVERVPCRRCRPEDLQGGLGR